MINIIKLLILLPVFSIAQSNTSFNHFLEENYEGGSRAFLEHLYEHVEYPGQARLNCIMGIIKVNLKLDTATNTVKVGFYNLQGYGLEQELLEALSLTQGKWKMNTTEDEADFFIDFRVNEEARYPEVISVIAKDNSSQCISTDQLIKKLSKYLGRKKYDKAQYIYDELINRNPYSKEYIEVQKLLIARNR